MKATVDRLKGKGQAGYVRAVGATVVLVSLAAVCGGVPLKNHNEMLVRDRQTV